MIVDTVIIVKKQVIKIRQFNEDNDEYTYDLDERNFEDTERCKMCGVKLIKGREKYEAWGSEFTYDIWYCPECS